MKPALKRIQISMLPPAMLKDIRERVYLYSIAMLIHDDNDADVTPCSGTLCKFKDKIGILTARHVWDHDENGIKKHSKLKIVFGNRGRYTLETKWLTPLYPEIEGNILNCQVPDIAFLCLPNIFHSTFESFTKLFYPADRVYEKYSNILFNSEGLWITSGSPKKRLNLKEREVALITYPAELEKKTEEGRWDFLYLNVVAEEEEMPDNVRGMSGGSIWRAVFSAREDLKEFKLHAVLLSGVNFCQTQFGQEYQIVGHGPKSIYQNLLNILQG